MDRTLDVLEHAGDPSKRPNGGSRISSQTDSDDGLDDVPLAELAKRRYTTRRRTSLPLLQQGNQGDTLVNQDDTYDDSSSKRQTDAPERVGDRAKRTKVASRKVSHPVSDELSADLGDDIPQLRVNEIPNVRH
ncbi:Unknown protein, partial [Striga hermonthica]